MKITEVFFKLVSLLPFWVLHRFSDLAFVFIYYFFGYRKKVVWENLKGSFPEKSDQELRRLQRRFYRNFCDLIFETLKTFTISEKELRRRCHLENPEILESLSDKKKKTWSEYPVIWEIGSGCHWPFRCLCPTLFLQSTNPSQAEG